MKYHLSLHENKDFATVCVRGELGVGKIMSFDIPMSVLPKKTLMRLLKHKVLHDEEWDFETYANVIDEHWDQMKLLKVTLEKKMAKLQQVEEKGYADF